MTATRNLPRVAKLSHSQPARKPRACNSDRFADYRSIYNAPEGPSVNAYADAAEKKLKKAPTASLNLGPSDRFAGVDSRYKRGYRKSTMPIHDPKVYAAKQVDESVPLPAVSRVPVAERRQIKPSNERFGAGSDSIYKSSDAPAPTAYEAAFNGSISTSSSGPDFEKQTERFASDSIYAAAYNGAPPVTKYDPAAVQDAMKSTASTFALPFDNGYEDRFAGPDSRYRRGLRRSTVPDQRDPSSFPMQAGISKRGAARGAALKAALKATLSSVDEAHEEVKENLAVE